jgi:aminopeptidase N
LSQLIQQIKNGKLSPIDRLKLLNEQTLLARAGIISSAELIPLIDAFKDETTEAVWGIISMTISELKKFTEDDKTAESKLRALAESISDKQFQKLGWTVQPGETISDSKLRDIIIGLKVYSEAPDIIDNAIKIYKTTPLDKLDPELRSLILIAAVRHNESDTLINELLAEYKNTGSAELKQDICVGLTSTKKAETVSQILNLVKDTNIIRTQDTAHWIIYLIRNKHGRVQTWQWIIDNWDWITATFGDSKDYDDYPRYCASAFSTKAQLDQYINFFTPLRADTSLTRAIDMGINEIKNRFETIEKDGQSVRLALLNL